MSWNAVKAIIDKYLFKYLINSIPKLVSIADEVNFRMSGC